jgi:hypothetical protein
MRGENVGEARNSCEGGRKEEDRDRRTGDPKPEVRKATLAHKPNSTAPMTDTDRSKLLKGAFAAISTILALDVGNRRLSRQS